MPAKKIITIILIVTIFIHANSQSFPEHKQLNDQLKTLNEFKDNDKMLKLKLEQLDYINQSRKKYKVQLLKFDILASRVANKMAQEAAQKKFMGHFNLKGEKPYHRYAFAGGLDHISENAGAISFENNTNHKDETILKNMQYIHDAFMSEKAPNDGHKQTCIHPHHNYVGIGVAFDGKEFRYYEEYVDRYLEFGDFETNAKPNEDIIIPVKLIDANKHVYFAIVYYESHLKKMNSNSLSRIYQYDDYTNKQYQSIPPWELPEKMSNDFQNLKFNLSKKGLYYIHIYLSDKPYKKGKADTKGKICASGIVINVN